MAWNKDAIQNNTKIRNYPSLLTDNFTPIETGENTSGTPSLKQACINFSDLAGDPTTAASTGRLFAKTIDSSIELNYMDQAGNVTQLTDFSFKTAANPGSIFLPGGILMQFGRASISNGSTFTFAKTFGTAPYSVQLTRLTTNPPPTTDAQDFPAVYNVTTTSFQVRISTVGGAALAGSYTYMYLAIGLV